jgi:hypothetical protein
VPEQYPRFRDRRAAEGRALPRCVEIEFEACLKCDLLAHGLPRASAGQGIEHLEAQGNGRSLSLQPRAAVAAPRSGLAWCRLQT